MTAHLCRAVGCLTVCQHVEQFFCGEHWTTLSKTRRRVILQWHQPDITDARQPSPFHAGMHDAIASLASKDGHLDARAKHQAQRDFWLERALHDGSYLEPMKLTAQDRFDLEELLELGLRTSPTLGRLRGYWVEEVVPVVAHLGDDAWRRLLEVAQKRRAQLEANPVGQASSRR